MQNQSKTLSLVIPVLNEAKSIALLLPRIAAILKQVGLNWEIIIVDDGGQDELAQICQDFLEKTQANLRLIILSRNFGKEAALNAGLAVAKGDAVLLMDGDGQHPPELIPEMIHLWEQGYEMVMGVIANRAHESWLLAHIKRVFYSFLGRGERFQIPENAGDFRLMSRRVVQALLALPERKRYMKGLYAWVGFKSVALPFSVADRVAGESKFKFMDLMELALEGITSFSMKPLRLVSRLGVIVSLLSVVYGAYIVIEYFFKGNSVPGWSTLAAGVMLLSGVQLVCIGLIGEYIGRLFDEVKQRPLYVVDQDINFSQLEGVASSQAFNGLWLNSNNQK